MDSHAHPCTPRLIIEPNHPTLPRASRVRVEVEVDPWPPYEAESSYSPHVFGYASEAKGARLAIGPIEPMPRTSRVRGGLNFELEGEREGKGEGQRP